MVATLERAQLREQLVSAADKAPSNTVDAALSVLRVAGEHEALGAFTARVLRAIAHLLESTNERVLLEAAGAPSDYAALLDVLAQPEAIIELQTSASASALIPARLAGLQAREQLLTAGGGVYTATQLAHVLGISRQAVDHRRRTGKLLALTLGRRGYAYPAWQVEEGRALAGLEAVLAELRAFDPWTQVAFVLNPNTWLDGETPLDLLRRGELERVQDAAHVYGEQLAA